jgi:hypothetical protein
MKNITTCLVSLAAVALATGCASGPKYSEISKSFPPLNPDQGRIFVYRNTALGAAVQPAVKLNDEQIGAAVPKGFFYVDRPSGQYELSTTTEVKRSVSMLLDKGQTRWVRLGISIGFFVGHVYPELVEPAKAEQEIQNCGYTGTILPKP